MAAVWKKLAYEADMNSLVNPLGYAQGVHLTAAASGSNGIQVADSVHLDQGTGAFTLSCKRNLASYVVAAILMEKHDDTTGYRLSTVVTTGYLKLEINDTIYTSNAAPAITGGTEHEFTVTASPGTTNTTVTFYCDGIIVGTAQTATNETTTDNAVFFYAMGTDAIRTAGIDKGDLVYNRALTAAQVLSLNRNGVDFSDVGGNQTNQITDAEDQSFGGGTIGNWIVSTNGNGTVTYDAGPAGEKTGLITVGGTPGTATSARLLAARFSTPVAYKYYIMECDVYLPAGHNFTTVWIYDQGTFAGSTASYVSATLATVNSWQHMSGLFLLASDVVGQILIDARSTTAADYLYFDNVVFKELGATLHLPPEGIKSNGWKGSANGLDATYPATGWSLVRPDLVDSLASPTFVTAKLTGLTGGYLPVHTSDAVGLANSIVSQSGTVINIAGSLVLPAAAYLNFGATQGTDGYGLFDEGGAIKVKNSGGAWTAIGTSGAPWSEPGTGNLLFGTNAGHDLAAGGVSNVAVGQNAMYYNQTGDYNTCLGRYAGRGVTGNSCDSNTAIGYGSLIAVTTGSWNSFVGDGSGNYLTTGGSNVGLGVSAGQTITTGSNNTCIGYIADVSAAAAVNRTAIGYQASSDGDNKIVLGNSSATTVGGYGNWSNYSDITLKEHFKDLVPGYGRDFLMLQKPWQFWHKTKKLWEEGFVAQEVKASIDNLGIEFCGWVAPGENGLQMLSYDRFVVPLVLGFQQHDDEIERLKIRVVELEEEVELLKAA